MTFPAFINSGIGIAVIWIAAPTRWGSIEDYAMSIRDWLYHRHYWGVPHKRESDSRIVQICYECGKEREVSMDLSPKKGADPDPDQKGKLAGGELGIKMVFNESGLL